MQLEISMPTEFGGYRFFVLNCLNLDIEQK